MPLETLFALANGAALLGWIALAAAPLSPAWADRIAATAIPALLSAAYATLVAAGLLGGAGDGDGGFGTLAGVMALFDRPAAVLAGWLHYLAFDLIVGAWIVRAARAEGMPHWRALICLPPTLFLGPVGFGLFLILRALHRRRSGGA